MSWSCHGSSHVSMCDALRAAGKIKSSRVYEAMKATDRGLYVAPTHVGPSAANSMRKNVEIAYTDRPQPIGHNATISAPHMHAMQLELLESAVPKEGGKVLDVGAGSGYIAACFARMVGTSGKVVGVEHIESLTTMAEANVRRDDASLLSGRLKLLTGDGRLGVPADGPYNAIHVGAAAPTLPKPLVDQLAPGGRLVCPVGPKGAMQKLILVDRSADGKRFEQQDLGGVIFVPLTDVAVQVDPNNSTKVNLLSIAKVGR